ncbi:MAG: laccase domain-containing protein, partial [Nitrospinae bacterium]|nr:laccase domain-containing protein [Nitrospinota bacterium]
MIKHKSQGIVWFSYEPLDNLGFLNNWTTTRTTDFAKNAGGSKSESLALANRVFAGGKKIYLPKQVHGTDIHELLGENDSTVPADAVFVKNPGLSVGVLTADCIPLILADPVQKTVCVVHAGRKGVFLNIVE